MKTAAFLALFVGTVLYPNLNAQPSAASALPWEQHGELRVSQNQRHLEHKDGTPFLWVGDTAWALFHKLSREEINYYLDDRQAKGFSVVQAVAYWYPHGEDGPGPHNPANHYGYRPFQGDANAPNTAAPLLVSGGSPDAPNDYWDHADFVVREVRKRGMYLALLPCWGRAYVNATFDKTHPTLTAGSAREFGRFLGRRYGEEPHVIWVLGGDVNPTKGAKDCRDIYRAMAEGIAKGALNEELRWNQPHPAWDRLLMTYHPEGDPLNGSSRYFHSDAWLDLNGIETWKSVDKVHAAVRQDHETRDPVRPTLFLEGAYEAGRYPEPGGRIGELSVRRQAWQSMLSGAAGHTYGASPIWHFQRRPKDGVRTNEWKHALQHPGARQVSELLKGILKEYHWWALVPDQTLILEGAGAGELTKVAARTQDGRRLLAYFADASPARLRLPKVPVSGTWINPASGDRLPARALEDHAYQPPPGWVDALLYLDSRPRVVVTTDINIMRGDPDDRQSLVHLLFYLDELDLRVLTADRSQERTDSGALRACEMALAAYAKDYTNQLTRFRGLGFPEPASVRERVFPGDARGVNAIVAEGRREDPRPLYVLAWGTLRVLRDALQTDPAIAQSMKVLSIGTFENPYAPPSKPGWNSAGRNDIFNDPRFQSLWWVENSDQYSLMFEGLSFGSVKGPGETQRIPTGGEPFEFLRQLSAYGALGKHLVEVTEGNEWARYFRAGDTPSVMYLLDPSQDHDNPAQPGWAGTFEKPFPGERPNHWTDAIWGLHNYTNPPVTRHLENQLKAKRKEEFLKQRKAFYEGFLEKLQRLYPAGR